MKTPYHYQMSYFQEVKIWFQSNCHPMNMAQWIPLLKMMAVVSKQSVTLSEKFSWKWWKFKYKGSLMCFRTNLSNALELRQCKNDWIAWRIFFVLKLARFFTRLYRVSEKAHQFQNKEISSGNLVVLILSLP